MCIVRGIVADDILCVLENNVIRLTPVRPRIKYDVVLFRQQLRVLSVEIRIGAPVHLYSHMSVLRPFAFTKAIYTVSLHRLLLRLWLKHRLCKVDDHVQN